MYHFKRVTALVALCGILAVSPRASGVDIHAKNASPGVSIRAPGASPGPQSVVTTPANAKSEPNPPSETAPPKQDELPSRVEAYFRAEDSAARRKLLREVVKLPGATVETVATAIRRAKLWDAVEPGVTTFSVHQPPAGSKPRVARVTVRVPKGYDPARAYPLLFAFPDTGITGERFVETVMGWLPPDGETFLIAAIENASGVWLGSAEEEAGGPLAILAELKHRYHMDTDRVYALGYGAGGHAAFVTATLYTDAFAAAVVIEGTLALQLGPEAAKVLLPNLHDTPTLVAYRQPEMRTSAPLAPQTVAAWNRYLTTAARDASLPLRFIELPATQSNTRQPATQSESPSQATQSEPQAQARGPNAATNEQDSTEAKSNTLPISPPASALQEILKTRRPKTPKRVAHTFRYQPQGRAAWLRMLTFQGEPWTAQRIVVEPAPTESKASAVKAILHEKLAHISGTIEGQTVRLESRNTDRLELRLSPDLLDLDREITIYLSGDERYTGPAAPKISTMLEIAQEDWEFQRLYSVRFRMSHDGRARQY